MITVVTHTYNEHKDSNAIHEALEYLGPTTIFWPYLGDNRLQVTLYPDRVTGEMNANEEELYTAVLAAIRDAPLPLPSRPALDRGLVLRALAKKLANEMLSSEETAILQRVRTE